MSFLPLVSCEKIGRGPLLARIHLPQRGAPLHVQRDQATSRYYVHLPVRLVSRQTLGGLPQFEDTIAVGFSSVMGPASPGRGAASPVSSSPLVSAAPAAPAASAPAPSPCHEVAASLLRSASLRASSPRTRTRSRSPAPLPKRAPRASRRSSSVASGLRGSVALAESGLVTGLATKSCPPVPPPQLRLSRVARALQAASTESQPSAVASGTLRSHSSCS